MNTFVRDDSGPAAAGADGRAGAAMNMTIGTADRKKVAILGGLLVVAAIVFWMNSSSGERTRRTPRPRAGRHLRPRPRWWLPRRR